MEGEATAVNIVEETPKERKGKAPLLAAAPAGGSTSSSSKSKLLRMVQPAAAAKGGYRRGLAVFDVMLRIAGIATALGAAIAMGSTDQTLPFFTQFFQFKASYDDVSAFS